MKAKELMVYLEKYPDYQITVDEVYDIRVDINTEDETLDICRED